MQFEIKNRIIKSKTEKLIIGDNADYTAHFSFDEEWEGVTKTARFISCKGEYKDVLLENDECLVPCEVLKCGYAKVGVYSAEMTTSECEFLVIASIKDEIGCECEPTPNVYEQLTGKLDEIQAELPNEVAEYFTEHKEEFKGDKGEKGDAGAVKFVVVAELPTEDIDEAAIYMKPVSDPEEQNTYQEYIFVNGKWECIGTAKVDVDLSGYVTSEEFEKIKTCETQIMGTKTATGYKYRAGGAKGGGEWPNASVLIGYDAKGNNYGNGVGIGFNASVIGGVSVGSGSVSHIQSVAIGYNAKTGANSSGNWFQGIQLGTGTNSTPKTLQIFNDNIYNHDTHTLTVQNIKLNGVDINAVIANAINTSIISALNTGV